MINIRLLTAAAAAAALLCLTGCQPKEDPLYLGNNAIVLETDEGRNGLYVKDADNGGASGDSLFGERCFIDCSHAQLYYYGLGTEELTEMKLGDLLAGDEVTIDLRESEVKKAGNGSASAEKIQLMTQRMSAENQSEEKSGESGGGGSGSGSSDSGSSGSGSSDSDSSSSGSDSSDSGSGGSGSDKSNSADSDSPRQAEANAEVPGSRAASLEESDYKGFAKQIQHIFSERDIEALAQLCAYPVYVTTEANTEGLDVADAAGLKAQKDDIFTDAMLQAVAGVDPDRLTPSQAGIFVGSESGSPGLFFSLAEDGYLKIMGINAEVLSQQE
ncbi:hypothetical protein HMPREF1093_03661 [Hungatella hathewayi 12489931]|uniref:hypothetical protein n=1 Tax=Hungatella hathewayi TaxID=154046 RepID=UPI0002D14FCF|nr:hypothetical protein [Hungatella hathewayi]ENY93584.1 hypothetical protein HMPREF1093_03661 [Hungatella hathewayi 12489931]